MEGQAVSTRINLAPVARATTTAMLCVMVENAGAQQFGDAEGGRKLARQTAPNATRLIGAQAPQLIPMRLLSRILPKPPA